MTLRIVYMGTPDFAVPALQAIIDNGFSVACVYSQPPRPKGRGQKVQPSPVHALAARHGIEVRTPRSLRRDPAAQEEFVRTGCDLAIVAAYGLLLPKAVLDAPLYGCVNIHASLLPRWRGASPIQHAVWHGDEKSGISLMRMEEGLDTGPVFAAEEVAIRPQTTAQSLHDELSALGAAMIVRLLRAAAAGGLPEAAAQDEARATYAPLLSKDDGRVDWTKEAAALDRQVRALNPWPGVWTMTGEGRRLKILAAEPASEMFSHPPGTLIDHAGHIACGGDTALRLRTVQPENGKPMDVVSAFNGGYLRDGETLE